METPSRRLSRLAIQTIWCAKNCGAILNLEKIMSGLFAGFFEAFVDGVLRFAFAFWCDNLKTAEQPVDDTKGPVVEVSRESSDRQEPPQAV